MELVDHDFPRKPKVLVVDDDWLNRDVLAIYFAHMGAEVISAPDGFKALELATADPPDLVMMDMAMPRMDGIEACRFLKSHPATQFVPVVIVTAMESDETRTRALAAGADDFITKPYSSALLMTRARALLKIKHLTDMLNLRTDLLRRVLNRYMAEEVADAILTDPERRLQLGGETRHVTVLFADIRGFTPFTEAHSAAEVVDVLNRVFSVLTRVIFKHNGTFDKYLGDAIMAFYGAPLAQADHPLRAVQTALEMQAVFQTLQAELPQLTGLGLGVGLHSGEATVGNIGSDKVMDYTVIGDVVNVAKRLTEEAPAGVILLSDATHTLVREIVEAEALGPRLIRGRVEPVTVFGIRLDAQGAAAPAAD
ncbi:MAG: response regulator [Anaerolineales bacterium]|nr:response regulator [Anaerolineales bacterium]